jgi:glutathione S-transferase
MNQVIGIVDWYFFHQVTAVIGFNRLLAPLLGKTPDEAAVAAAVPKAKTCLDALEHLKGNGRFMAGNDISIADLMLAPQLATFMLTPEGQHLLPGRALADWLAMMNERRSMQATMRERLLAREQVAA